VNDVALLGECRKAFVAVRFAPSHLATTTSSDTLAFVALLGSRASSHVTSKKSSGSSARFVTPSLPSFALC